MKYLKPVYAIHNPDNRCAMVRIDTNPNAPWANFGQIGYVDRDYASVFAASIDLAFALEQCLPFVEALQQLCGGEKEAFAIEIAKRALAKARGEES